MIPDTVRQMLDRLGIACEIMPIDPAFADTEAFAARTTCRSSNPPTRS